MRLGIYEPLAVEEERVKNENVFCCCCVVVVCQQKNDVVQEATTGGEQTVQEIGRASQ